MADAITLAERGRPVAFALEDLMRYHGPGSPGGVAHAFKVMERALPLLAGGAPPERRELTVRTAFGGPGARDAFELVTRAVTEGRFTLDPALARPERGRTLERFVFRLEYRGRAVTLVARQGTVPDELIELARRDLLTEAQAARFAAVKIATAELVMALPAKEVYDVDDGAA